MSFLKEKKHKSNVFRDMVLRARGVKGFQQGLIQDAPKRTGARLAFWVENYKVFVRKDIFSADLTQF